jgi:hypothetical protein
LAACEAWNIRMKGWRRSHRHDALNAGYRSEVQWLPDA